MTAPALLTLTPADVSAWRPLVPPHDTLPRAPRRMIWHWTGGTHVPNASHDLRSYSYVVAGPEGAVRTGRFGIADNCRAPLAAGCYAAHTGGFNGSSIGISWCGMKDADATSGRFGRWPITGGQLHRGLAFSAFVGLQLGLDVADPAQAFTHREAWELHRVRGTVNHTKPDWIVLPPVAGVGGWQACGAWMRAAAAGYAEQLRLLLDAPSPPQARPAPRPPAPPPVAPPPVTPLRTWVLTTSAVRVRPSPGTRQPPLAALPAGTRVVVDGTATGEDVGGNRRWYRRLEGGWVWAGATDQPG